MTQFDQVFQEQLAAHYLRDDVFIQSVGSLVSPDYFENETLAAVVSVQSVYLERYGACCTLKTFVQVMNRLVATKKVKIADMAEAKRLLAVVWRDPLHDRQFVIDTIAEFARKQALGNSAMVLVDALDQNDDGAIQKALGGVEVAKEVGAADTNRAHNYKQGLQERLARRRARLNGSASVRGISTGIKEFDDLLTPHRGFGRRELTILMGPPKSGKTAAMVTLAINAATAGSNVFYASCEVDDEIIGDRCDANISGVFLKELEAREAEVESSIDAWSSAATTGELIVEAFPIRTLKVSALKRVLKRYEAQGVTFDAVFVDYGDILAPEERMNDKRHELAQIFQDLRALASTMNCAVITATQTNREGTKKAKNNVTDGTDAAEDYEKVRTADALITINASEDDKQNGEVVLYFSEMRNAESGLRLRFKQTIQNMRFLESFVGLD